MELAYIAGPYTADTIYGTRKNILRAEELTVELLKQGYAVICPHKNTAYLDGIIEHEQFMKCCLRILSACDHLFMLKNWDTSKGAIEEHEFAETHNIPITYTYF